MAEDLTEKKWNYLICCAIFSWASTCNETKKKKRRRATQVGHWAVERPCSSQIVVYNRGNGSVSHMTPLEVTLSRCPRKHDSDSSSSGARLLCFPAIFFFFLLYQPHLTMLLLSLHRFSVNSLENAFGLKRRFSQAKITEANMLTMPCETKLWHFYIHVVPDSNM